ncbi:MAG: hypothetical protein P1Q69_10050 [Candidatus Thorarchaeota archaeon]|nr:hypothetical protein [Candidatus Thorarchaeota archaeon]
MSSTIALEFLHNSKYQSLVYMPLGFTVGMVFWNLFVEPLSYAAIEESVGLLLGLSMLSMIIASLLSLMKPIEEFTNLLLTIIGKIYSRKSKLRATPCGDYHTNTRDLQEYHFKRIRLCDLPIDVKCKNSPFLNSDKARLITTLAFISMTSLLPYSGFVSSNIAPFFASLSIVGILVAIVVLNKIYQRIPVVSSMVKLYKVGAWIERTRIMTPKINLALERSIKTLSEKQEEMKNADGTPIDMEKALKMKMITFLQQEMRDWVSEFGKRSKPDSALLQIVTFAQTNMPSTIEAGDYHLANQVLEDVWDLFLQITRGFGCHWLFSSEMFDDNLLEYAVGYVEMDRIHYLTVIRDDTLRDKMVLEN